MPCTTRPAEACCQGVQLSLVQGPGLCSSIKPAELHPAAGGVPGRVQPAADAPPLPVFFSNPDVVFSNEFPAPRFGQGAFAAALMAAHKAVSVGDCLLLQLHHRMDLKCKTVIALNLMACAVSTWPSSAGVWPVAYAGPDL